MPRDVFPLTPVAACRVIGEKTLYDARHSVSEHQDLDTCIRLADKATDIEARNHSAICLTLAQLIAQDAVFLQSLERKLLL